MPDSGSSRVFQWDAVASSIPEQKEKKKLYDFIAK